ncbi:MAG: Isoquinoline 1-oxidoreductase beta subunit [Rhodospirillales bacterium]|nr:Isoquinoline 1-oxidoreductase beta subunit [Rhodospirillales bacterium]
MGTMPNLSRRQFIVTAAAVGGGMALSVVPAEAAFLGTEPWAASDGLAGAEFSPWISITPDDVVTVRVATPEIGNGVMTQTPMTVAEELACDWSKIRAEFAPTSRDYRENGVYAPGNSPTGYFSGRSTSEDRMKLLLQVGASARERLKTAAAATWKVPVSEIGAKDSVLTHTPTGRTLRYGEVAAKAATIKLDVEPTPKPQSEWTLLGKATPTKLNNADIVNGSLIYGMDVRLPNMVYAALRQSPVHGGMLKSYDAEKVKSMPGVLAVVTVDPRETPGLAMKSGAPFGYGDTHARSAVAVIAEHYWQARKALDALPVEWDDGAGAQWKSTEQMVDAAIAALDKPSESIEKATGDARLIDSQDKIVEAVYVTPFSDQAPMEPLNSTALVTADRVDVWHPGQQSRQAFWVAADEAGMDPSKVFYHQTFIGGAFGRRIFGDDLRMAVAVAKKFPGRPVHTIWSREEQTRQGKYRPLVATKLRAGLDKTGMPAAFIAHQATKGHFPRLADTPYALGCIPNVRVDAQELPFHVITGAYRGPGYNSYAFMIETFIDECALAAGMDPLEYRLKLFAKWPDPGWTKVLKEVADKSGWGKTLPKGAGQGIAIANWGMNGKPQAGTTVGVVATVEVTKSGILKVHQIDAAFDCGRVVNHDAALNLVQGGLIFGLNMALNEEMNVKDGRMVEGNFDQYPILRTGDTPVVNVHFGGLSGHDRFAELGEPPAGPVGPAIGNAIFRATGKRIRSTPIRKHDLSWA